MNNNELSVIIPCFNEEKNISTLVKRVRSILKKHEIDGQIIIIDDFSTDETYIS